MMGELEELKERQINVRLGLDLNENGNMVCMHRSAH